MRLRDIPNLLSLIRMALAIPITRFNHAFEALTGKSAHDVIGKSINILFPADKVDSSMEFIREAVPQYWLNTD